MSRQPDFAGPGLTSSVRRLRDLGRVRSRLMLPFLPVPFLPVPFLSGRAAGSVEDPSFEVVDHLGCVQGMKELVHGGAWR